LRVWVRNPAPAPREHDALHAGAGHARNSIGQRLAFAFGKGARMTGHWDEGYYQAEFRVPLAGGAAR
jgi:two-component system sensor histidine kinase AlgZ